MNKYSGKTSETGVQYNQAVNSCSGIYLGVISNCVFKSMDRPTDTKKNLIIISITAVVFAHYRKQNICNGITDSKFSNTRTDCKENQRFRLMDDSIVNMSSIEDLFDVVGDFFFM